MIQLKIRKDLWEDIVSGKKAFEFRKLSKGLTTGIYDFVSIEDNCNKCKGTNFERRAPFDSITCSNCRGFHPPEPKEIYGEAKLTPMVVNPEAHLLSADKKSYDFVRKNYIDKHDFIAYRITEVREMHNETNR